MTNTIHIIAPANPMHELPKSMLEIGEQKLKALGFEVQYAVNAFEHSGHTAGSIEQRVEDIHQGLRDPKVIALMAIFGGYNSNQLLPYLDYELIRSANKPIIGFSDITSLMVGVYSQTGVASIHGPGLSSFCDPNIFPEVMESFTQLLSSAGRIKLRQPRLAAADLWYLKSGFGPRDTYPHPDWEVVRSGSASGILMGGNLETLLSLVGTSYFPDMKGKLLLIESCADEKVGKFERELTQLQQMGVLSVIKGMLIGQSNQGAPLASPQKVTEIIERVMPDDMIPVWMNVSASHVDPILSLPIGREVSMSVEDFACTLQFSPLI
ncbi:LD-carboxypeptidase [Vibrio ostreicida]|uniref:LD-carboxypeptidase n=1 Tax=Vibrio ostreicida TaxID=526588 RepID=A0ABT8BVJ3_9VIBR|nr:LD-carboxypeptidase [Vibrio ostreicida]MDN3610409.1 LD-carboxypeptidase [Vibrio ostreicida]NPD07581.1 LD-carboxypeptidase [Vibrio ostreicida]